MVVVLLLISGLSASPLDGSTQLLVARAASWDASNGDLRRFERDRDGEPWRAVDAAPMPVVFGVNGLAWGRGLHPVVKGGKLEGDGRAPAGVFALGSAFGYANALDGVKLPYRASKASDRCVDDPSSEHYNRVVARSAGRWRSAERMRRKDALYRLGVFVDHNGMIDGTPERGAGSCIFLHIWRRPGRGTAGCTAMAADRLEAIVRWLEPERQPLYVLLPVDVYEAKRDAWGLPAWLP